MEQCPKLPNKKASKKVEQRTQGKLCPKEVPTKLLKIKKDNHSKAVEIDQRSYSKLRNNYSKKSMETL